jgi:putative FmdB family regulatory protein
MPTYHYRCRNCSHEFDEFQRISDDPLISCPACKDNALKRIIGSGAGLIFKGSGFYLTDYKKTNSSPSMSDESRTESKSKTEVKPETPSTPLKSEDKGKSEK